MKVFVRFLVVMVLVSLGSEFIAPLLAPAHACESMKTASAQSLDTVASSEQAANSCHHHSPVCEISGHCHNGHCSWIGRYQVATFTSDLLQTWLLNEESAPQSPHLSGLKRPPISNS